MEAPALTNGVHPLDLSIRFKHGNQTIFLFVSAGEPLHYIRDELLDILKDRYPNGITTSLDPPKKTDIPDDASQLRFAVAKDKSDPTQGWKQLVIGEHDTPDSHGFQNNMIVAFAIAGEDEDEDNVNFEVEFPAFEYEPA
ncbi:hypothetical protein GGR50DRAFT_681201 [Xylaria sp. CBS 124048]|nr:hypothetical protein GGR50DRAFT_681201 [Xylaria sp. CBS 124048]